MKLKRHRKNFTVPIFSTSDIAFLLLIFIMLVSLINYRVSVNISYAEAETALRVDIQRNLEIWVDRSGNYFLDGYPANLRLIEQGIIDARANDPETRIHVIADRDANFETVHRVLQILQGIQHRLVSFVVKNE